MENTRKLLPVFLLILLTLFISNNNFAEGGKKKKKLTKVQGSPEWTKFNIGNFSYWVKNNGITDYNPQSGSSGFHYPKISNTWYKQVIFQSGLLWGGFQNETLKVGGSYYNSGLRPGSILSNGKRENENLDHVRIYRVRSDVYKNSNADLSVEMKDQGYTYDAVYEQYQKDWEEWPAEYGAPYEDLNNNGTYEPSVDIPGYPGADQTVWYVANDLDTAACHSLLGSDPIGMEVQATFWGYNEDPPSGNIGYRQFKLINKSNDTIRNTYISYWSDTEVGDAGNDHVGGDSSLSLGYCFNAIPNDAQYGFHVPAVGFVYLQGINKKTGNPNDFIIDSGHKITGIKNTGMSGFTPIFKHDQEYGDWSLGRYDGTIEAYNFMQVLGASGKPWVNPFTGDTIKFPLNGDPITGKGWINNEYYYPADRRLMINSGPFNMAPGDTQTVIVAVIAAGVEVNSNYLTSISVLKLYAEFANLSYNLGLVPLKAPTEPEVSVSELDQKIILNWGENQTMVNEIEQHSFGGYKFQGYNVYQLPYNYSSTDEKIKIAAFDINDGITNVLQKAVELKTGLLIDEVIQTGTDSGIEYYLEINKDSVRSMPLYNGQQYHFAVTAYSVRDEYGSYPASLESEPVVLTAIPKTVDPGTRYNASAGDSIVFEHTSGLADVEVTGLIEDPSALTGNTYKLSFDEPGGNTVYQLLNLSTGDTLIKNFSTGKFTPLIDGFRIYTGAEVKNYSGFYVTQNAGGVLDPPEGAAADWYDWAHGPAHGSTGPTERQQTNGSTWLIHALDNSYTYYKDFLSRTTQYTGGFGEPDQGIGSMLKYDYEFRFTAAGDVGFYNWSSTLAFNPIPFEVWNTKGNDDPSDDFKVMAFILDNEDNDQFNLTSVPLLDAAFGAGHTANDADHDISGADNDPYTDGIYLVQPLDESPGTAGFDALKTQIEADPAAASGALLWAFKDAAYNSVASLMRLTFVNWNGGDVSGDVSNYNAQLPEPGTIFRIELAKPFTQEDEYIFTTPKHTYAVETAKSDIEEINVFPNPYYGKNFSETMSTGPFVTFNHLPQRATIRIFTLNGQLVKVIEKDSPSQYQRFVLVNDNNWLLASGLYIAYIEMPDIGATKILKFSIIQDIGYIIN